MKKTLSQTCIILAGLSAAAAIFINRSISRAALMKNILHPENGHTWQWKFGKVFYRKEGTGEKNLLLVHAANPCSSGYEWNFLAARLRSEYTIYTIDLCGCGRSDKPALTYTHYFYTLLIRDFIKDVIKSPCDIAASGNASLFAVSAARESDIEVTGLYLIPNQDLSVTDHTPDNHSRFVRFILGTPILGSTVYHFFTSKQNIAFRLEEKTYFNPFHLKATVKDAMYEAAHRGQTRGRYLLGSLLGNYLNLPAEPLFRNLDVPVTVLIGQEALHRQDILRSYKAVCPEAVITAIPKSGGMPHLENPSDTASVFLGL